MVQPEPQSQHERHWTNCQHDLHTSCQQHLGCCVEEWWGTDASRNVPICPIWIYIPCETVGFSGYKRSSCSDFSILVLIPITQNLSQRMCHIWVQVWRAAHWRSPPFGSRDSVGTLLLPKLLVGEESGCN